MKQLTITDLLTRAHKERLWSPKDGGVTFGNEGRNYTSFICIYKLGLCGQWALGHKWNGYSVMAAWDSGENLLRIRSSKVRERRIKRILRAALQQLGLQQLIIKHLTKNLQQGDKIQLTHDAFLPAARRLYWKE